MSSRVRPSGNLPVTLADVSYCPRRHRSVHRLVADFIASNEISSPFPIVVPLMMLARIKDSLRTLRQAVDLPSQGDMEDDEREHAGHRTEYRGRVDDHERGASGPECSEHHARPAKALAEGRSSQQRTLRQVTVPAGGASEGWSGAGRAVTPAAACGVARSRRSAG